MLSVLSLSLDIIIQGEAMLRCLSALLIVQCEIWYKRAHRT